MTRMIRKQVCIDDELDRRLETLAGSRHVSQSEIVRDALTAYFDQTEATRQARIEAMDRFLNGAKALSKTAPAGWKPMSREEAHERRHFR